MFKIKISNFLYIILLASCSGLAIQQQTINNNQPKETTANTVAGTLGGKFSVNKEGSMKYRIALEVPPGTNGMEPSLSLSYSSNYPNEYLGQGWYLEGMPKIERVAATIAQDNFWGTISTDTTARYALNGQRLMLSVQYGSDSCSYKTEIESWSKIISYGAFSEPDSFRVWTKKGQLLTYGTSDSSKLYASDSDFAWEWLLASQSDLHQNSIQYNHWIDSQNGVSYPYHIAYTANKNRSAQRHVYFSYEPRQDTITVFSGGNLTQYTYRLDSIYTKVNEDIALQYSLVYDTASVTGRSLLSSVTKCDQNGNCYPANTFTWQQSEKTLLIRCSSFRNPPFLQELLT